MTPITAAPILPPFTLANNSPAKFLQSTSTDDTCSSRDSFCLDDIPPRVGDFPFSEEPLIKWPHAMPGAYTDNGWSLQLEPMQFIGGAPSVNVTEITKRDGKVILEGNGFYTGVSAFPPVSFNYTHLQVAKREIYRTNVNGIAETTGAFTFDPEAQISIGVKAQLLNMQHKRFSLEMDEQQFYDDLANAAEQGGDVNFEAPELGDNLSPEEMQAYLEDYGSYLNDVISSYSFLFQFLTPILDSLGLLDAQDYVQFDATEEKELFFKVDMPVSVSIGSWLHDNGGQFFGGKVGVGRSIRLGAHIGPTLIYGKSLGGVKGYANGGLFVDASALTFYFPKQPTQRSLDVHLRLGLDAYLNFDGEPNDFGSVDAGVVLEKRF